MDTSPLRELIDQYRIGLDAEITILLRLQQTAARQREASAAHDIDALNRASDERDSLMAGLVNVESQLKDVRKASRWSPRFSRPTPNPPRRSPKPNSPAATQRARWNKARRRSRPIAA
jgi:hypothetical protein